MKFQVETEKLNILLQTSHKPDTKAYGEGFTIFHKAEYKSLKAFAQESEAGTFFQEGDTTFLKCYSQNREIIIVAMKGNELQLV